MLGAEEEVPWPGMDPERLTEQPHCLCVVSGTEAGLWVADCCINLITPGHSTWQSLEPLSVASQPSPRLFPDPS